MIPKILKRIYYLTDSEDDKVNDFIQDTIPEYDNRCKEFEDKCPKCGENMELEPTFCPFCACQIY